MRKRSKKNSEQSPGSVPRVRSTDSLILDPEKGWPGIRPSAIFCADLHIRADVPVCRTDDFRDRQRLKVGFLAKMVEKYDIPVFVAGDFGHRAFWPNELLTDVINVFGNNGAMDRFHVVPGQHDLPQHRLDRWNAGALGVLHASEAIYACAICGSLTGWTGWASYYFPFGNDIKPPNKDVGIIRRNVAVAHMMAIEDKPLWPGQEAPRGTDLLRKYPEYDLIVTGDNHNPFVIEYEGRLHINPGSMMRQTAAQADHRPRFYLWWAKTNQCMPVFWPIEDEAVSRSHLDREQVINEKIEAFISSLQVEDEQAEVDFRENLERFVVGQGAKLDERTIEKIWESMP